jgi:mono/diheme cytochrome c family protein
MLEGGRGEEHARTIARHHGRPRAHPKSRPASRAVSCYRSRKAHIRRKLAPPHELPFPMTIRRLVGFWKLIYLDRSPVGYDPSRDAEWNRGHYLVEALGHCAECHSSRNIAGGIKSGTRYAGGADQENVGFVPTITPAGIGQWSREDLQHALTAGVTPRGRVLGSTMAEVVAGIAALPESDQRAIATYVKSLPPRRTPSP